MSFEETRLGGGSAAFQPTLWTLVLRAKDPTSSDRRAALDELLRRYWKPVYFFIRRKEPNVETATDLTQAFFCEFLERDFLASVDRGRGKFRTFLLTTLAHFLANERERERAQKRGGGKPVLSLDFVEAETEVGSLPSASPESLFERQWALLVLDRAIRGLRTEPRFDVLSAHLSGGPAPSYADTAARLGTSVPAVKDTLHRLRLRLREKVRDEIRAYVDGESQVEEEILALFRAFR